MTCAYCKDIAVCVICGKGVTASAFEPKPRDDRFCGNCADGVPGGPDNCSKCGRDGVSYSHWTPRNGGVKTSAGGQP